MKKRMLACLLLVAMLMSMTACTGGTSVNNDKSSTAKDSSTVESTTNPDGEKTASKCSDPTHVWDPYTPYAEPVTFTRGATKPSASDNFPEGDDYQNNAYTRYVKEQINTEVELAWQTDPANYDQKVSLCLASGDIPDTMIVTRKIFEQLAENDLIWDLSDAYESCIGDFVKNQMDTFEGASIKEVTRDGKMLGVPASVLTGMHTITWVRKDWLDKLGLPVPKTLDEILTTAQTFVEKDPGGNGAGKTVGFTADASVTGSYNGHYSMYNIFTAMGSFPNAWIERDGKVVNGSVLPETKTALEKLAQLYKDGILDKEFAIRKGEDQTALINTGKTGIVFAPWHAGWGMGAVIKNNPDAEWITVSGPTDNEGKLHTVTDDPLAGILVVSKKFEHPEAIIKTLNVCNDMLRANGESGKKAYDEMFKIQPVVGWWTMPIPLEINTRDMIGDLALDFEKAYAAKDINTMQFKGFSGEYDGIAKDFDNPRSDPNNYGARLARVDGSKTSFADNIVREQRMFYGTTGTMAKKQAALDKLQTETFVKIVMGEKPIDEFDKFVETWHKMGGQEITDEVNADVESRK